MNLRFPGQYWDRETNSHYNFNRDYFPGAGRYTQLDPIGLKGGVNLFTYGLADPINKVDPNGLNCVTLVDITIPNLWWTETGRSGKKYTSDWILTTVLVEPAISPIKGNKPWDYRNVLPKALAKCFFTRPFVEEIYKERRGRRLQWGVCVDACFGSSTWFREDEVTIDSKTEVENGFDNRTSVEKIDAPVDILGLIACRKSL